MDNEYRREKKKVFAEIEWAKKYMEDDPKYLNLCRRGLIHAYKKYLHRIGIYNALHSTLSLRDFHKNPEAFHSHQIYLHYNLHLWRNK